LIPYRLTRLGIVMVPAPGDPLEAEGVLNPAVGHTPDGRLHLLPRVVATGNVSRVGLAEVVIEDGIPVGVDRRGVVLEPELSWERGVDHAGVEDPRVTYIDRLGVHVMTYVAFGPLGPRIAVAVARDLRSWQRLGPVLFGYEAEWGVDLNLYPNKDALFFPEPIPGPNGEPCYAMLHRPMWHVDWLGVGDALVPPAGIDERPGIWISYAPAHVVESDLTALTMLRSHRCVAVGQFAFETAKIGGGPPPIRIPEGWLLIHHGVAGEVPNGFDPTAPSTAVYCAGAMVLDPDDPARALDRTAEPLLRPQTADEQVGTVANVVFPTAIASTGPRQFVFYGMADARIGVAELERIVA
jgi:predicted GH43/DUF377 family glycosyl hydrolase